MRVTLFTFTLLPFIFLTFPDLRCGIFDFLFLTFRRSRKIFLKNDPIR